MIEYATQCINNDGDITYEGVRSTLQDARTLVEHYRELIRDNGEEDSHNYINIVKQVCGSDGEVEKETIIEQHFV